MGSIALKGAGIALFFVVWIYITIVFAAMIIRIARMPKADVSLTAAALKDAIWQAATRPLSRLEVIQETGYPKLTLIPVEGAMRFTPRGPVSVDGDQLRMLRQYNLELTNPHKFSFRELRLRFQFPYSVIGFEVLDHNKALDLQAGPEEAVFNIGASPGSRIEFSRKPLTPHATLSAADLEPGASVKILLTLDVSRDIWIKKENEVDLSTIAYYVDANFTRQIGSTQVSQRTAYPIRLNNELELVLESPLEDLSRFTFIRSWAVDF